jgi:hypothetical protein
MLVISWNALVRKYEEKYNPTSLILKKYPEEQKRLTEIVDIIAGIITPDTIVCLQECSQALVEMLENTLGEYRIFKKMIFEDEFLVTIVKKDTNLEVEENSVPLRRGCLVLVNAFYRIINCHLVPQKYIEIPIFDNLKSIAKNDKINFICGDFNSIYLEKIFPKKYYTVPFFGTTYKKKSIDNIIVSRPNLDHTAYKIDPEQLSDHTIIKLDVNC